MEQFLQAYIDPGSGALLLQALGAGAIGAIALFRQTIQGIASKLFGRGRAASSDSTPSSR
jgi:hypothetical protein